MPWWKKSFATSMWIVPLYLPGNNLTFLNCCVGVRVTVGVLPAVVVASAPDCPAGASIGIAALTAWLDARVSAATGWFGSIIGVVVRFGGNSKLYADIVIETSSRVTDRPK
jgi:hypothetical protein